MSDEKPTDAAMSLAEIIERAIGTKSMEALREKAEKGLLASPYPPDHLYGTQTGRDIFTRNEREDRVSEKNSVATAALKLAIFRHFGQRDMSGDPYILHPERVGEAVAHLGENFEATGYLHDVVVDTEVTLDDLRQSFPEEVVDGVDAVTRRPFETYRDFVLRAAAHPIGRAVKLADMRDNLRPGASEYLYERYRWGIAEIEKMIEGEES